MVQEEEHLEERGEWHLDQVHRGKGKKGKDHFLGNVSCATNGGIPLALAPCQEKRMPRVDRARAHGAKDKGKKALPGIAAIAVRMGTPHATAGKKQEKGKANPGRVGEKEQGKDM